MSGNLLSRLEEIREAAGHEPMPDPTRISGFGPGTEPEPPLPEDPFEDDDDEGFTELPPAASGGPEWREPPASRPSPLIPAPQTPRAAPAPELAEIDLLVANDQAAYKGRKVSLKPREQADLIKIILKAIRRSLDEQYQEVAGTRPRRARNPVNSGDPVSTPTPARRVRRKTALKP